jgi:thioesterase-3
MKESITEIKVRGYHADLYGHVNNARYLEMLEEARWNHFETAVDYNEFKANGWAFVIVNININYRKPAVPGDIIQIHTAYKTHGSRSMTMHQRVLLNGTETVSADADVTFVVLDANSGKVVPIQGRLLEMLTPEGETAVEN